MDAMDDHPSASVHQSVIAALLADGTSPRAALAAVGHLQANPSDLVGLISALIERQGPERVLEWASWIMSAAKLHS